MNKFPAELFVTFEKCDGESYPVAHESKEAAINSAEESGDFVGVYTFVEKKKAVVTRTLASWASVLLLVLLNGCMGFTTIEHPIEGDKPVTFVKDAEGRIVKAKVADEHYVVLTRGTVDSWTVDQDHSQDLKHCRHKYTSEKMAAIRTARPHTGAVSWYYGCTYMVKPQLAKDSSKIEKTAGIAMAGAIGYAGHAIGRGLGKSGTTVNQEGGGAESNSNADASSNSDADANASHQQNVGNKTTNIKPSTNINSNNVIKTK